MSEGLRSPSLPLALSVKPTILGPAGFGSALFLLGLAAGEGPPPTTSDGTAVHHHHHHHGYPAAAAILLALLLGGGCAPGPRIDLGLLQPLPAGCQVLSTPVGTMWRCAIPCPGAEELSRERAR